MDEWPATLQASLQERPDQEGVPYPVCEMFFALFEMKVPQRCRMAALRLALSQDTRGFDPSAKLWTGMASAKGVRSATALNGRSHYYNDCWLHDRS